MDHYHIVRAKDALLSYRPWNNDKDAMLAMWNEIDAINSEKALVKFLHREDIRVAYLGDKYTKAMLINSTDQYGVVAFILKELRKEL